MNRTIRSLIQVAIAGALMLPLAATASTQKPAAPASTTKSTMKMSTPKPTGPLTPVEGRMICMVNNKAYAKPQLPVRVHGRTYYGCCSMCKHMLQTDASERSAVDPISKKKVDKSKAVIGRASNDAVVYFQNDADLQRYNASVAR